MTGSLAFTGLLEFTKGQPYYNLLCNFGSLHMTCYDLSEIAVDIAICLPLRYFGKL